METGIGNLLTAMARSHRRAQFEDSPQLTLGELIERLEALPATREALDGSTQPKDVVFDFCRAFPWSIASYRGYYDELALQYVFPGDQTDPHTVEKFLELLYAAASSVFQGYKGGDYRASSSTPVWVSNWGDVDDTIVVGVTDAGHQVVINTAYFDSWS